MNGRSRITAALNHERTDRLPVWLMRQAGRMLPGYRALRRRHTFMDMIRDPELACRVSLEPIDILDVDAAIVFHDILIPLERLGMSIRFEDGAGPILSHPVATMADIDAMTPSADSSNEKSAVVKTLARMRRELGDDRAVLGFAGAPWTVGVYALEGRSSRQHAPARAAAHHQPDLVSALLMTLAPVIADYLIAQAPHTDAIQIFESHADILPPDMYERLALPALKETIHRVRDVLPNHPLILYGRGLDRLVDIVAPLNVTAYSPDWNVSLPEIADRFAKLKRYPVLQGNLDPAALLSDPGHVRESASRFLRSVTDHMPRKDGVVPTGWIVNLGHGVLPDTDPQSARAFVDAVHAFSE